MHNLLSAQYDEVKGARAALFAYCDTISDIDLLKGIAEFNNTSILSLLTHIANTYMHWLAQFDENSDLIFFDDLSVSKLTDVITIYDQIDHVVSDFLDRYSADYTKPITQKLPRRDHVLTVTPLQLYTHAITHEFHHKGQVLSMSRLLGYIPQDTDVIRF
ncbi:DUF664 domain-containing protein [Mucilaginibacter corticis]|uniref:DUF664 domain-containing protein n=1 Tax=Mucilaginibacter corticis TaxID=2597670 RepID=A0A556MIH6_9SPHI|nr:DinB family protein [Mucilaginibacter corticis]TSJ39662.1 DUF664 domain-containing protein [Mucilaginibacter corticis]